MNHQNTTIVVPVSMKLEMLDRIENARGQKNRSSYIRDIIGTYFKAFDEVRA